MALYWEIGKAIQKKQEQLGWGKAVVETLAKDLQAAFPGRNGFSARNLWDMKHLYANYVAAPTLRRLVAELGWGANLLIMRRCKGGLSQQEQDRRGVCPAYRISCHRRGELLGRAAATGGLPRSIAQPRGDRRADEGLVGAQPGFHSAATSYAVSESGPCGSWLGTCTTRKSVMAAPLGTLESCTRDTGGYPPDSRMARPTGIHLAGVRKRTRSRVAATRPLGTRIEYAPV